MTGKITDETIAAVHRYIQQALFNLGAWNKTEACKRRIEQFISELQAEAENQPDPDAWIMEAAAERLRLPRYWAFFKPSPEEAKAANTKPRADK